MLSKFLKFDQFDLPTISGETNQVDLAKLDLQFSISCRREELSVNKDMSVYTFVHSENGEERGKVEQFIWNIWDISDPYDAEFYYWLVEQKTKKEQIPTSLSPEAVDELVYLLYNGSFREDIKYEVLVDLESNARFLNLRKVVYQNIENEAKERVTLSNLKRAWEGQLGKETLATTIPFLRDRTVAYILCYPDKVFGSKDSWFDMPEQVLQLLKSKALVKNLERYIEHGATLENRKLYYKREKCYLNCSHFKLLYFLLQWAKKKFTVESNLYDLRKTLGKFVDLLDADTFDVSKFTRDSAIDNGQTFVSYLGVYIHLMNLTKATVLDQRQVEHLTLPPPVWLREESDDEMDSQPLKKRSRTELSDTSNASSCPPPPSPFVLQGEYSTSPVEQIKLLFGKTRMTDVGIFIEGKSEPLRLHSYVLELRQSAFSEYLIKNRAVSHVFELGECSWETVSNFFHSFYLTKDDPQLASFLNLEYCFLSLLFKVEFLLETALRFTSAVSGCMEAKFMSYVSAVRMGLRSPGDFTKKQETLKAEIQRNLPKVIKTVCFRYLVDEAMVEELLTNYEPSNSAFYFELISELESASRTMRWLRKEDRAMIEQRMRTWKANGVIKLDKVSKEGLKDLARRGLLGMEDAIEYSYAMGCNSNRK